MTLTELKYIVALAQHQHFGKAAEACHVTQPTLSLGIKKLEDELNVSLFERSARNELRITHQGELIVQQAQVVLEQAQQIRQIANTSRDPLSGPLRLGVIYTIAPYLLPELIPRLHKQADQMPLVIEENYTSVLSEQLKQGQLDVIIIALPFEQTGVITQSLYDEPFIAASPKNHPWGKRKQLRVEELADESLLLLGPGNCFRDQILQACPECQSSSHLQQSLQGSSLETIRQMVASGTGVTVLPSSADRKPLNSSLLKMIPFKAPAPSRRVALAWRKSFTRPQAIEILRRTVLQCKLNGVKFIDEAVDIPQ